MKEFSELLKELTSISPRKGEGEKKAAETIKSHLKANGIVFVEHKFTIKIPVIIKKELYADGEEIPCLCSSFVSGKFDKSSKVYNTYSFDSDKPSIVFSPVSEGVCLQEQKKVPVIAINRDSAVKLMLSKEVKGEVIVEQMEYDTENILVGNVKNPKTIIFAHYDSVVGSGAIDNAGSVDVIYKVLKSKSELLVQNLFVFAGAEESSISNPDGFWGFEMFDKEYSNLLDQTGKILALDGVGMTKSSITKENTDWVFWIKRSDEVNNKVYWMLNDQSQVMKYYHTKLDTLDKLEPKFLDDAVELVIKFLEK